MGPLSLGFLLLVLWGMYSQERRQAGRIYAALQFPISLPAETLVKAGNFQFLNFFWWAVGLRFAAGLLRLGITEYATPRLGADTYLYFNGCRQIFAAFWNNPATGLEMIFRDPEHWSASARLYATHWSFFHETTAWVIRVMSVPNLLFFNSYLALALLGCFLGFLGSWRIYKTFYHLYPQLATPLAIATLFPFSVVFYGNNLFKDPLAIFCLGSLTWTAAQIFLLRRFRWTMLLTVPLYAVFLFFVKGYILLTFLAAMGLYGLWVFRWPIRERAVRLVLKTVTVVGLVGLFAVAAQLVLNNAKRYSADVIAERAENLSGDTNEFADAGSAYDIGTLTFTPLGFASVFTQAVIVTYFRPWPWEIKKAIMLPIGLEALATLLLFLYVLWRVGIRGFFRTMARERIIVFCLLFAVLYGIVTGMFSFTFGTLSRYKVPGLPFFYVALVLVYCRAKFISPTKRIDQPDLPARFGRNEFRPT